MSWNWSLAGGSARVSAHQRGGSELCDTSEADDDSNEMNDVSKLAAGFGLAADEPGAVRLMPHFAPG